MGLKSLWAHFQSKQSQVISASIYSVLNKIFDIAPPLLIGLAVDTVVKADNSFLADYGFKDRYDQIYILGFLTFIIWTLESITEYLLKIKWRGLAQEVQHSLRMETYSHLQSLHMSFYEDQSTGNLTNIINDDVNQLERFLDIGANEIIQVLTTVISIGTIYFIISPLIASFSFLPIPLLLWGSIYFQKKIAPRYKHVRSQSGLLSSILTNNLAGMATIKSYVAEKFEYQRLEKQSMSYASANKEAIKLSSSFSPLIRMVILCAFMIILMLGGIHVFEGKLEVGAYSTMIFMIQRLLWPLTRLGSIFDLYQRAMASTDRVLSLLNVKHEISNGVEVAKRETFKGIIEFKNVNFSYDSGDEVLKDINLKLESNKTIALVGTTGSGKSTILKLLLRFYDVTGGEILVDGINLKDYEQNSVRRLIGLVSQETYLFHGSVKENILYGSFNKSQEELIKAAKLAEAHDFIEALPEGYETIVGERGQKLSGGQRQRISIARAIIKNPKIFIFDEATSAVDNETEASIQRSLSHITKSTSTIMVAHRLSTIKHADMIYVIEGGQIIESGSHEDLLSKRAAYNSLWQVQTGHHQPEFSS